MSTIVKNSILYNATYLKTFFWHDNGKYVSRVNGAEVALFFFSQLALKIEKALIWLEDRFFTWKTFKPPRGWQLSSSGNLILLPGISKTEKGKYLQSGLELWYRLLFSYLLLRKGCIINANI